MNENDETDTVVNETFVAGLTTALPEAGGIAWCELYGYSMDDLGERHQVKINLTCRATTGIKALDELFEALAYAKELKLTPYTRQGTAPKVDKPVDTPLDKPANNEPQANPVDQSEDKTFRIVKLDVTPRADGKVKVGLFGEGRKFADLNIVNTPERLALMFSKTGKWEAEHFTQSAAYKVDYIVGWEYSENKNSAGNPYKNVVSIESA